MINTYGYEDPVVMPTMQVYDTDLAKMYIAGVKDLYDKAQDEMKDFMKLYLDFYSPVEGATEAYHNLTTGGAMDMINLMYANGIDPYKSPQARAMISRYIAATPVGKLKQLEQQRDNYNQYQKAYAQALANGLTSREAEEFLRGDKYNNFKAIDENGNINTWDRLVPTNVRSLHDITKGEYEKFKPVELLGRDGYYDILGVSKENRALANKANMTAMANTEEGRWYRHLAEQKLGMVPGTEGYDKNAVDAMLSQMIDTENPMLSVRQLAQDRLKLAEMANNNHQAALNRANDREIAGLKNGGDPPTNIGFSTRTNADSNSKYANRNLSNVSNTVKNIATQYLRIADMLKSKRRKDKNGIEIEKDLIIGNKRYTEQALRNMAKWFTDNPNPNANKESLQAYINRGYIDENGNYTAKFKNHITTMYQMSGSQLVDYGTHTTLARTLNDSKRASDYYNNYTLGIQGSTSSELLHNFVGSKALPEKSLSGFGKAFDFDFSKGGWSISQVRHSGVSGYKGNLKLLDLQQYLYNNGIVGGVKNSTQLTSYASIPNANGGFDLDVSGKVNVKIDQLDSFCKMHGANTDSEKAKLFKELGLSVKTMDGKNYTTRTETDRDNTSKSDKLTIHSTTTTTKTLNKDLYVTIPVTRINENYGYGFSDLDSEIDKTLFSGTKAYDLYPNRLLSSLIESGQ